MYGLIGDQRQTENEPEEDRCIRQTDAMAVISGLDKHVYGLIGDQRQTENEPEEDRCIRWPGTAEHLYLAGNSKPGFLPSPA